jgi:hypothetical protein
VLRRHICRGIIVEVVWELRAKDAGVEGPFEVVNTNDTADYEKEERDNRHIKESRNSHDECLNSNSQAFVLADHSEGPQYS